MNCLLVPLLCFLMVLVSTMLWWTWSR
jgi:hypothetical protein